MPNLLESLLYPKIKIASSSLTDEQKEDTDFKGMMLYANLCFNDPQHFTPKVRKNLCLHEGAHLYYVRLYRGTDIEMLGPEIRYVDGKFELVQGSVRWTIPEDITTVERFKIGMAGFICRREISGTPDHEGTIAADLANLRRWLDDCSIGQAGFDVETELAENSLMEDLQEAAIRDGILTSAEEFGDVVFPLEPTPPLTPHGRDRFAYYNSCVSVVL